MFNRKQQDAYDNTLNVMINLTEQFQVHNYCKVIYEDLNYLIKYTDKFCRKANISFFDIDVLTSGLQFDEIISKDNFKKPVWFTPKSKDDIVYVLIYNIPELSSRSLAFKQIEVLLKKNSIRDYLVPLNVHFIFVGEHDDLPMSNVVSIDLDQYA